MKRTAMILAALVLVTILSINVCAAPADVAATAEKVVFIQGDWAYEKVNTYGYEIDEYVGSDTDVNVPYSFARQFVTTIGDHAFANNHTVQTVNLTQYIESVSEYAFNDCTSLENVILFGSLTEIGVGCFYGSSALTGINLQDTAITAVSAYCFAECGISTIALPDSCEKIGSYAFYNCASLVRIDIPDSVTEIAENAFLGCENLVIYAKGESYAIEYAIAKGIDYVITDAPVDVTYLVGDADGDEKITILDATKIQRVLAALVADTDGMIALRGDSDGNGLDILDATRIQRWLAGFTTEYPIGEEKTVSVIPSIA